MLKYVRDIDFSFIFVISVLFCSCHSPYTAKPIKEGLPYIVDFEQCMETEQAMKISDIADTVEYIELRTPKDLPITRVWDIIPVDDFWIIHTRDGVYKFTNKGEYIKTIGRRGQGPGEYNTVFNIDVDLLKKEIIISLSGQLLYYSLEGDYLHTETKKKGLYNIGVSNSTLWGSEALTHIDEYMACAVDSNQNVITFISNPFYGIESQDGGSGFSSARRLKAFYRYKDTLYLKGRTANDTIYQLAGARYTPYVAFNMGKYKLPMEYEAWYNYEAAEKNGSRYWGIPSVAEDDRFLFLYAQRCAAVDGNKYVHNEENFRYIIYDKEKRKGFVTNGDKGTRFTDDILGGPAIWPYWVIGDYYMNVIEWDELSDEIKNGNYKLAPAFQKQLASYGYDTNPLVVMCRRKK